MGLVLSKMNKLWHRFRVAVSRDYPTQEVLEAVVSASDFQTTCSLACKEPFAKYRVFTSKAIRRLADQSASSFSHTKYIKDWVYQFILTQHITLQRDLEKNVKKDSAICVTVLIDDGISQEHRQHQLNFLKIAQRMKQDARDDRVDNRQFSIVRINLSGPGALSAIDQNDISDGLVGFIEGISMGPDRAAYFSQFCGDEEGYRTRRGAITVPGSFVVCMIYVSITTDTRFTDLVAYTKSAWDVEWTSIRPIVTKVLSSWDEISTLCLTRKTERLRRMGPARKKNIHHFSYAIKETLRIYGVEPQPEFVDEVGVSQYADAAEL